MRINKAGLRQAGPQALAIAKGEVKDQTTIEQLDITILELNRFAENRWRAFWE